MRRADVKLSIAQKLTDAERHKRFVETAKKVAASESTDYLTRFSTTLTLKQMPRLTAIAKIVNWDKRKLRIKLTYQGFHDFIFSVFNNYSPLRPIGRNKR